MRLLTIWVLALVLASGCSVAVSDTRCDYLTRPAPDDSALRTIQTRVVEHSPWRMSPGRNTDELLAETSALWEQEFGIRFEIVARESVDAPPMFLTKTAWDEAVATRRFQGDEELILIFSRSAGLNPETAGVLAGLVVVAPGPLGSSFHLLNHGLGHVFGVGHDARLGSFMDGTPLTATPGLAAALRTGFTHESKAVIRNNKWCSFRPERPYHLRPVNASEDDLQTANAAVEPPG